MLLNYETLTLKHKNQKIDTSDGTLERTHDGRNIYQLQTIIIIVIF